MKTTSLRKQPAPGPADSGNFHVSDESLLELALDEIHHLYREAIEEHVRACPRCDARLREMRETYREAFDDARPVAGDVTPPRPGGGVAFSADPAPVADRAAAVVDFAVLQEEFPTLAGAAAQQEFLASLMLPHTRRWFRACHALVHAEAGAPRSAELLDALDLLPERQRAMALTHHRVACELRAAGRSLEDARPRLDRLATDSIPSGMILDLAHELLTSPQRLAELIASAASGAAWHGDLRPTERADKVTGLLVEIHRDHRDDEAIPVTITLEIVTSAASGGPSLRFFPAPAFALWDRSDDFCAAEDAARKRAAAVLLTREAEPAPENGVPTSVPAGSCFEVRWRFSLGRTRAWPPRIYGPSLGLAFAFLLRRILARPDELIARLNLEGVALTGALGRDSRVLPVGEIMRKIPDAGVHTLVAPRQQIEHPGVKRVDGNDAAPRGLPDTADILSARGGAVHILRVANVEEAVELLAVDHASRWLGIDFDLPVLPPDYVGRVRLADELVSFVERTASGYGIVVGAIGAGKTTFFQYLTHRFTDEGCRPTFHFIPAQPGSANLAENVATELYYRLRRKHGIAEPVKWADWPIVRKLDVFLKALSANHRNTGAKEVIIVDAADQVELTGQARLVPDILPAELPEGVVILISTRPNVRHWLGDRQSVAGYFYMRRGVGTAEASTDDRADIGEFLLKQHIYQPLDPAFIKAIVAPPAPAPVFFTIVKRLQELAGLTGSNRDPERREELLSDPELWTDLPLHLIEAKIDHICRSVDRPGEMEEQARQALAIMALVREPVTARQLDGLGLSIPGVTASVLREAESFFDARVGSTDTDKPYRFDHPGYPRRIRKWVGDSLCEAVQRLLADRCLQWHKYEDESTQHYAMRHGPAHLRRAGMWQELHELLTDFAYLEARMDPRHRASEKERAETRPEELPERLVARVVHHFDRALRRDRAFPADWPGRPEIAAIHEVLATHAATLQQSPHLLVQILHNELIWQWRGTPLGRKLETALARPGRTVLERVNPPVSAPDRVPCLTLRKHRDAVNCVALSPDEKTVASASNDGTVILWSIARGDVLQVLREPGSKMRSVAWRPDGARVATAGNVVRMWDPRTGALRWELPVHGNPALVAFSPGGDQLAVAGDDGSVQLFDAESGTGLGVLRAVGPRICCMAFSPDGSLLATGGLDMTPGYGAVELFQVADRSLLRRLPRFEHWIGALAFTRDGRTLVTGSGFKKGDIRFFDVATGAFQRALEGHRGGVQGLALSDHGLLLTGSFDHTVLLREIASSAPLRRRMGHNEEVCTVAINRAGTVAISAGEDRTVRVWQLGLAPDSTPQDAAALRPVEAHHDRIWTSRFSSDGDYIVSASLDATARVFFTKNMKLCRVFPGLGDTVNVAAISRDGRRLAVASCDVIRIFDVASGAELHCLRGHRSWILDLAWSEDGSRLISVSEDATAMVWNVTTGRWHRTLTGHTGRLRAVVISSDGKEAATAGDDARIHIWDFENGGPPRRTLHGHNQPVKALAWRDNYLASAGSDEFIKLWDATNAREIATVSAPGQDIWALALAPEKYLASGGKDGIARVFDLGLIGTGANPQVATLACRDSIQALWFSPDSTRFCVADRGGADFIPNVCDTRIKSRLQDP